jgi:hypothetical protein
MEERIQVLASDNSMPPKGQPSLENVSRKKGRRSAFMKG